MANVTYTVFITAQTATGELQTAAGRKRAAELLRGAHCTRVAIESYREGLSVPLRTLESLRDFFEREGFATMGGIMPIQGNGFGKRAQGVETRLPVFCYTDEATVEALEGELTKMAKLFPAIVIDDAFLTSCRCSNCQDRRGARKWGAFRRDLLCEVAQRWVAAAKRENPAVRMIVKFPQYYDRCHLFGYDAARFPQIFDAVWVGTETRNPNTPHYGYVMPYQGYFNARWMRACAGDKFDGAWYDSLDCNDQYFFEQEVTTRLANPPGVTLFSYSESLFASSKIRRTIESSEKLAALQAMAVEPEGVHVVRPPNSDGGQDLFLPDYLGMLGLPCIPATTLDPKAKSVILPTHAMSDVHIREALPHYLMGGGQAILTAGALERIRDDAALLELFGYAPGGVHAARADVVQFEINGERFAPQDPQQIAFDLAPQDAAVRVYAQIAPWVSGVARIPYVTTRNLLNGGRAIVWNVHTWGHAAFPIQEPLNVPLQPCIVNLPYGLVHMLRAQATRPLGFTLDLPSQVASFVFRDWLVFVNYRMRPVEVRVDGIAWDGTGCLSDSSQSVATHETLLMGAGSFLAVRRAR